MLKPDESLLLDFLRGGSAVLVLVAHVQQILINPSWMPFSLNERSDVVSFIYSQIGALGVMIFFVLSGFLITYSIDDNLKKNRYQKFDAAKYFKSRLRRLLPPLFFSQGLVLLVFGLLYFFDANSSTFFATGKELYLARSKLEFNVVDYLGSFFFLNTIIDDVSSPIINGPLWSVAQEFWFYVIAGLLVLSFYNRKVLVALAIVLTFLISQGSVFFLYGFGVWLFGCLAAVLHIKKFYERKTVIVMTICLITFFMWSVLIYLNESSFIRARHKFVFGVAFSFILLLLLNANSLVRAAARLWLVKKIAGQAGFSYTLYLIHFPLLLFIWVFTNKYVQGDILLAFSLASVSVVLVMWVSAKASNLIEGDAKMKARQRYLSPTLPDTFSASESSNGIDVKL
ncbi:MULTISPECIES: acyltransferase [unclassified Microbulbifer]|uniref:acyltransferase family protein n=1 Tax=unclassified Microbulbifer TaxID=2619833 RepID=UPI0027E43EAD|nr:MULTISPECIES: acyltransferase [unclassified Microbulbifer]